MNAVGHVEMQGAINLLSFRTDAAAMATEKDELRWLVGSYDETREFISVGWSLRQDRCESSTR